MVRIKQMLRAIITGVIAFVMVNFWKNPEGYWLILSSLVLINLQIENSFLKNQLFILMVGVLLATNTEVANFLIFYIYLLAGYVFTITFFSVYFGLKYPSYLYPLFIINLLGIFATGLETSLVQQLNRLEAIVAGIGLVLLLRCLCWPTTLLRQWGVLYQEYLDSLQALQKKIFEIYLNRDYSYKTYFYERELHQKRFELSSAMNKMRCLVVNMSTSHRYAHLVNRLDCMIESVIALGSLRYRIRDFSTLEVCEKELKATTDTITHALQNLMCGKEVPLNPSLIHSFEELYQTTLIVVTNDPQVYLVFIYHIKELLYELRNLSLEKGGV